MHVAHRPRTVEEPDDGAVDRAAKISWAATPVDVAMAQAAQNNQILLGIMSELAAPNQMMNLEVGSAAAALALPTVTRQDPLEPAAPAR